MQHCRRVSEIGCGPCRRIDAHGAHRANNQNIIYALGIEQSLEFRLAKRIGVILYDDWLVFDRSDRGMSRRPLRSRREKGSIRLREFVSDGDDFVATRAGGCDYASGIVSCGFDTDER